MSEKSAMDKWLNKVWDKARGIETTDYNNSAVLVRASVEEVGDTFMQEYPDAKWSRDVLGRDIVPGQEGFFIFRLQGHCWTELLHHRDHRVRQSVLKQDYIERLSRDLKTRVISYFVGDAAGVIGYTLLERGEVLEKFGSNGEEVKFNSKIRNLSVDEIENAWKFPHEFFVEQDALEPGIQPGYFLTDYYDTLPEVRPGQRVRVHNPGFILFGVGVSTPGLERVDYVALA